MSGSKDMMLTASDKIKEKDVRDLGRAMKFGPDRTPQMLYLTKFAPEIFRVLRVSARCTQRPCRLFIILYLTFSTGPGVSLMFHSDVPL